MAFSMSRNRKTAIVVIVVLAVAFVAFSVVSFALRQNAQREAERIEAENQASGQVSILEQGSEEAQRAASYGNEERNLLSKLSATNWATKDGRSVWSFSMQQNSITMSEKGNVVTDPFVIYGVSRNGETTSAVVKIGQTFCTLALAKDPATTPQKEYIMISAIGDEEPRYQSSKSESIDVIGIPDWVPSLGLDRSSVEAAVGKYVLEKHPAAKTATFCDEAIVSKSGNDTLVTMEFSVDDGSNKTVKAVMSVSGASQPVITG